MSADPTIHLTAVFEVLANIDEIGAVAGDRIVVRPWRRDDRCCVLVRPLGIAAVRWAFRPECALDFTRPAAPPHQALPRLRRDLSRWHPRWGHLRLIE
jgi:hypothetical protein